MPLDPPRSTYRQLADLLREAIERGDYPPGSTLESETELGARYGVARHTVNRAMLLLRGEGLVRVERGNRTVVRELPMLNRDAAGRQRVRGHNEARGAFQAELTALGLEARSGVEVSEQPAPDDIAALLGVEPGSPALTRARRMLAGNVPVQLATSWLPLDIAAGTQLAEDDPGPGGIYSRLADLGHAPVIFTELVRLRLPDDHERQFLRLDVEQRVYAIRRIASDKQNRIVEVNDIVLPAHQWQLAYTWQAD